MENKRLFISIPVDPVLTKKISKDLLNLNLPKDRIRFTKIENIHLTMKFLGDTPIDRLDEIIQVLNNLSQDFGTFELSLAQTKIFPENQPDQTPRVLSLSLVEEPKLQVLYEAIDESLWQAGFANREMRRFTPHLTLGRVYPGVNRSDLQEFLDWKIQGLFYVDHLELQESSPAKGGPEYSVLNTFDL